MAMADDPSNGGLSQIEEHYRTFIVRSLVLLIWLWRRIDVSSDRLQTEKDIAEIAGTGLTWVRLPIGFWAIETWPGEPFLERTSWRYVVLYHFSPPHPVI